MLKIEVDTALLFYMAHHTFRAVKFYKSLLRKGILIKQKN